MSDELLVLREAIRRRGPADVDAAARLVADYLDGVLHDAGAAGNAGARQWARDRLRLFMVVSWGNWFGMLERLPREYPMLRAEWRGLLAEPARFGPEHLVAWWWRLQPATFQPLVATQLREMSTPLRDAVAGVLKDGGDFEGRLVDWAAFATY
ncbi:hypothetical protein Dvina_15960 [Dactylosporangium vinaceum]|uniref:Uncharacterized protein n=1 Tax=Dactylosporangium vinaceum TaxID=53362 RepID=A0ABV5M277_9ACTN|nr:hypothetical protein [Dactylosporangium vinaceum]UAB99433.1 hypothetical protein Dvina_15960 [Dactylosporangium vinaceum]